VNERAADEIRRAAGYVRGRLEVLSQTHNRRELKPIVEPQL